jgi:CRISPR system Cascade subunit CasA
MNLLNDAWIPVRPLDGGGSVKITLQELLCTNQHWQLCLPRDDMELAALQLLISMVQISWIPEDDASLRRFLNQPLSETDFEAGVAPWGDMFQLDHPKYPFMQVKGVVAQKTTGLFKLMSGLSGGQNCTFVNEPGQGDFLCGGCVAIALFNQANNAPSLGGGSKWGLRGTRCPVTTLIQAVDHRRADLRTTLWLNVLTRPRLHALLGDDLRLQQKPSWQEPIKEKSRISVASIGLLRGLFWQPNHVELTAPVGPGQCSGCGQRVDVRYSGFLNAKFKFDIDGTWPHPHSPYLVQNKKGQLDKQFLAFTTAAPSWTQLSRVLVKMDVNKTEDQFPAAVVSQSQDVFRAAATHLIVGGYRNKQATVLERRHEVMALHQGWQTHGDVIQRLVEIGLGYKDALYKALSYFCNGGGKNSGIKGSGIEVHKKAERDFFRQSEPLVMGLLASLDFAGPVPQFDQLRASLHQICIQLFEQATEAYSHHPKLVRTIAVARRTLHKHLSDLKPQQGDHHAA